MTYCYSFFSILHAGFSTDGDFNSLRSKGKKRPISIIEVIRTAKARARQIKAKTLTNYFTLDNSGMYSNKFVRLTNVLSYVILTKWLFYMYLHLSFFLTF